MPSYADLESVSSGTEAAFQLRSALNPGLHVIIAHGLFDLVCPYFGSQLLVSQIAPGAGADRVKLLTYPGYHMFYSRDGSRTAFHEQRFS